VETESRSTSWVWTVSFLLLLATMINYMDRQTLSNLAPRISKQWDLSNEEYGDIEFIFGVTFAVGSLFFGFLADKVSVRWLYPAVLVAWSAVGFATGLTRGYWSMFLCRGLLGFFESGHWPCALVVTQGILSRGQRVMGNSVLQSGASLGAIFTPLIIRQLIGDSTTADVWRMPFFVIGSVGLAWAFLWLLVVKPRDLRRPHDRPTAQSPNTLDRHSPAPSRFWNVFFDRRFWGLIVMVICINTSWQLIRAWLPKFLQEGRGYSEAQALYFNSIYFVFTDLGCIGAGLAALALARHGMSIHRSRVAVYLVASLMAGMTLAAALTPSGWLLLAFLLVVAAGTLGVFPCYYSFTQELTSSHLGRLTGIFSFVGWLVSAPIQKLFGAIVDARGSFDEPFALLGWLPFLGLLGFLLLWPAERGPSETRTPKTESPE